MRWTKEKPTQSGFYWVKWSDGERVRTDVVKISGHFMFWTGEGIERLHGSDNLWWPVPIEAPLPNKESIGPQNPYIVLKTGETSVELSGFSEGAKP